MEESLESGLEGDLRGLFRHLDSAHAELVAARKIAALSGHDSYEEIGDAIECVEAAFGWLLSRQDHLMKEYPGEWVGPIIPQDA